MDEFKYHARIKRLGRWRCQCCNPWKDKQLARRYVRRSMKNALVWD